MAKTFLKLTIGFLVGLVAGAGLMLIAFPYLFPPPIVDESLDQIGGVTSETRLYSGVFREDAPGQDFVHWAKGSVRVHQTSVDAIWIQLESDFEASPGPNYWVYLNSQAGIDDEADFLADEKRLRLTKLKSFRGSQLYPTSLSQLSGKQALTVWCETFDQYIGSADFEAASLSAEDP